MTDPTLTLLAPVALAAAHHTDDTGHPTRYAQGQGFVCEVCDDDHATFVAEWAAGDVPTARFVK